MSRPMVLATKPVVTVVPPPDTPDTCTHMLAEGGVVSDDQKRPVVHGCQPVLLVVDLAVEDIVTARGN